MCLQALAYFPSLLLLFDLSRSVFIFLLLAGAYFPLSTAHLPFGLLPSDCSFILQTAAFFLCLTFSNIILAQNLSCYSIGFVLISIPEPLVDIQNPHASLESSTEPRL